MLVRILTLAALLAVSGCARYWARPGGTAEAFDTAKARCEAEAFARFPPVSQFGVPDSEQIAPLPDLCGAGARRDACMSNGGIFVPPSFPRRGMSGPAHEMFGACMIAAGWRPVRDAEEGEAVRRGRLPAGG